MGSYSVSPLAVSAAMCSAGDSQMDLQSKIVLKCDDEIDVDGNVQRGVPQHERRQRRKHERGCSGSV